MICSLAWRLLVWCYWWERQPCRGWQKSAFYSRGWGFRWSSGAGRGGRQPCRRRNPWRGAGDLYRLYGYVFGVTGRCGLVMTGGRKLVIYLAAAGLVTRRYCRPALKKTASVCTAGGPPSCKGYLITNVLMMFSAVVCAFADCPR